jgi:hypothetical protein
MRYRDLIDAQGDSPLTHQKQIFVGKLDGELWASEKNDLRAAISAGILGKARAGGFWAASLLRDD